MPSLPEQHGVPHRAALGLTLTFSTGALTRHSEVYSAKVWPVRLPLGQAECDLLARV
ncbi:hypothetical protein BH20ACT12_BH20ACT12_04680 [soil metagenome]